MVSPVNLLIQSTLHTIRLVHSTVKNVTQMGNYVQPDRTLPIIILGV